MPPLVYTPLAPYLPKKYCGAEKKQAPETHAGDADEYRLENILRPEVAVYRSRANQLSVYAATEERRYLLGDLRDLLSWSGSTKDFVPNIQGRMGERLFSLVLEECISRMVQESQDAGFPKAGGKVLREKRRYRQGRGDIVYFNNEYVLKFDRRTTFVLLQKMREGSHEFRYKQEQLGLELVEIDGLAYLHVNGKKYLFAGEVKTRVNASPNPWGIEDVPPSSDRSLESRLFAPLRTLYPDHEMVYVIMAHPQVLFREAKGEKKEEAPVLNTQTAALVERLNAGGIAVLPLIFPEGVDCNRIANRFQRSLHQVRAVFDNLREMLAGSGGWMGRGE